MRIDPGSIRPVGPKHAEGASRSGKAEGTGGAEKAASAAEVQMAHQAAGAAAEVRLDRVAELRTRIERGEFKVNAEKVASAMVEGG